MAIQNKNLSICLVLCIAAIVPTLAHIGEFDDYWKQRSEKASIVNHAAFNPKPHEITDEFNHHVGKALKSNNATGRHLLGHGARQPGAPCEAINPIDKCWRCDPNWAANRKKLADCGLGFGKKAVGGKGGPIYVVTDASDDDMVNPKPGTLRHAVIQKGPLWIVFKHAMIIRLKQELLVQSEKTIDARGANVHIAWGAGITLQFVNNVIIHGLHIHDIWPTNGGMIRDAVDHVGLRTKSDGDGISIFGSSTIWIDHVSMRQCGDGLIDVVQGSTAITISNSHFTDHNEAMLFGASDKNHADQKMQITVAFNHFGKGLVQRMPRCRFGFFHIVNNDYTHWVMYAIGGSQNPTIISQGNRYIAPDNPLTKNICNRLAQPAEWKQWSWRSENDWMVNGAFFESTGNPQAAQQFPCKEFLISPQPGLEAPKLAKFSGSLSCCEGKPC